MNPTHSLSSAYRHYLFTESTLHIPPKPNSLMKDLGSSLHLLSSRQIGKKGENEIEWLQNITTCLKALDAHPDNLLTFVVTTLNSSRTEGGEFDERVARFLHTFWTGERREVFQHALPTFPAGVTRELFHLACAYKNAPLTEDILAFHPAFLNTERLSTLLEKLVVYSQAPCCGRISPQVFVETTLEALKHHRYWEQLEAEAAHRIRKQFEGLGKRELLSLLPPPPAT